MVPEELFSQSLNGEFFLNILQLLLLFYPTFTGVDPDPYWEYGSGSTDHNTDQQKGYLSLGVSNAKGTKE